MAQENPSGSEAAPSLTLESAFGLLSGDAAGDDENRPASAGGRPAEPDAGEDEAIVEEAASTVEAIEPPASWRPADHEMFRSLPPALQRRIASREQQRERAVNEALRESAAHRRSIEGERAAFEAERQQLRHRLDSLILGAQHELAAEFADIRTPADLVALAQKDPARYAVLRARQDALQHAQAEQTQLHARAVEQQSAQLQTVIEQEKKALIEKRPDLRDKSVRDRLARDLKEYAVGLGYTAEQFDGNLSHVNLLVLEKAMLYDRAQRARAQAVSRNVPRVQTPGTAATRGERASDARTAKLNRLGRTGRIEDAVGLLRI
jgi:hypothetical protein